MSTSSVDDNTIRGMLTDYARRSGISPARVALVVGIVILMILGGVWWFVIRGSAPASAPKTIPPAKVATASDPFPNAAFPPPSPEQAAPVPRQESPKAAASQPSASKQEAVPAPKDPVKAEAKKKEAERFAKEPDVPAAVAPRKRVSDRFYGWIPPDATVVNRRRCYVDRQVDRMPDRCSSLMVVAKRPNEPFRSWMGRATSSPH